MYWFLYDTDLRHERVNGNLEFFQNSETRVTYSRVCDSMNKCFVIFRRQFNLVSLATLLITEFIVYMFSVYKWTSHIYGVNLKASSHDILERLIHFRPMFPFYTP